MTISAKTYNIHNSPSIQPVQVELTGYAGVLAAEEIIKFKKELEKMNKQIEQQNALLEQVVSNTKYPLKPYTVDDFEAMFGLKKSAQRNYRKAGKIGYIKFGETVLYTHQHILDFIQIHDSRNKLKMD